MSLNNRVTWFLVVIAITILWGEYPSPTHSKQNSLWAQDATRSGASGRAGSQSPASPPPRGSGGRGSFPGRGSDGIPSPGSPMLGGGRGTFMLSDAEIEQIIQTVQRRDPNLAKELRDIRSTNPRLFDSELRRTPEFGNFVDSRLSQSRGRIPTEFLDWLGKYLPNDANDLRSLRQKDIDLYIGKYNNTYQKYRNIFEQTRMNSDPNLAVILIDDLEMGYKQNDLQRQIQDPRNEQKKAELITELTEVLSDRYDIIIKRKQLQYDQLLKNLNDLQKQIKASMDEIDRWKDEEFKVLQIQNQIDYLTRPSRGGPYGPIRR
jgi:hypothetical protein